MCKQPKFDGNMQMSTNMTAYARVEELRQWICFLTRWFVVFNEAIGQNKKGVTFFFTHCKYISLILLSLDELDYNRSPQNPLYFLSLSYLLSEKSFFFFYNRLYNVAF